MKWIINGDVWILESTGTIMPKIVMATVDEYGEAVIYLASTFVAKSIFLTYPSQEVGVKDISKAWGIE